MQSLSHPKKVNMTRFSTMFQGSLLKKPTESNWKGAMNIMFMSSGGHLEKNYASHLYSTMSLYLR